MSTANATSVTVRFDPTANSQQADIIQAVTSKTAGVMTPSLLAQIIAFGAVTLYINEATGLDTNDGLTPGTALKTAPAAVNKTPAGFKGAVILDFAAGDYPLTSAVFGSPLGTEAAFVFINGTVVEDALGELVMDGASTNTSWIAPTAATVDGAYRGMYVRNKTSGVRGMITGNTFAAGKTTFDILLNFNSNPSADDVFVVEVPGTNFIAPPDANIRLASAFRPSAFITNIAFKADPTSAYGFIPLVEFNGQFILDECSFDGGVHSRAVSIGGSWSGLDAFTDAGVSAINTSFGAGASFDYMNINNMVFTNTNVGMTGTHSFFVVAIDSDGGSYSFSTNSSAGFVFGSIRNSPADGISLADNSVGFNFGSIEISNSVGNGLHCDESKFRSDVITGTGNGGAGESAQNASFILNNMFGGTTTVTGTGGDTLVGVVSKAYGALPYSEVDGTGPTLNRIQ